MSFKQAQDRLRECYLYTQIEVTDDLNLILFNSIFWKHSKRNNQQYQWFPNIFDHLPLLLNYRLKIPHYQKHPPTPKKKKHPTKITIIAILPMKHLNHHSNVQKEVDYSVLFCPDIYEQESSVIQKKVHQYMASDYLFPTNGVSFGRISTCQMSFSFQLDFTYARKGTFEIN